MAVPKRKLSRTRRDKRRSSVWKLKAPAIAKCSACGEFKLSHCMCPECKTYNGRMVAKKDAE